MYAFLQRKMRPLVLIVREVSLRILREEIVRDNDVVQTFRRREPA
jgi:hypothetical protein